MNKLKQYDLISADSTTNMLEAENGEYMLSFDANQRIELYKRQISTLISRSKKNGSK